MAYSFTRGLGKGALSLLAITGSLVAFAGFSDITIWSLLEQYLRPVVGSLTTGGVIVMLVNYIKVRSKTVV